MRTRILVADDHSLLREGLGSLLSSDPALQVVGQASDGRAVLELARKHKPHVVLMDIVMPELNGVDATFQLASEMPGVRVLALSMKKDPRSVAAMLRAGVAGYIPKDSTFEELRLAIATVERGEIYVSPAVAGGTLREYVQNVPTGLPPEESVLTPREREVIQLLAEGRSTKEAAHTLEISGKTVDTHRKNVMKKLGINSVAGLTKYAVRERITTLD